MLLLMSVLLYFGVIDSISADSSFDPMTSVKNGYGRVLFSPTREDGSRDFNISFDDGSLLSVQTLLFWFDTLTMPEMKLTITANVVVKGKRINAANNNTMLALISNSSITWQISSEIGYVPQLFIKDAGMRKIAYSGCEVHPDDIAENVKDPLLSTIDGSDNQQLPGTANKRVYLLTLLPRTTSRELAQRLAKDDTIHFSPLQAWIQLENDVNVGNGTARFNTLVPFAYGTVGGRCRPFSSFDKVPEKEVTISPTSLRFHIENVDYLRANFNLIAFGDHVIDVARLFADHQSIGAWHGVRTLLASKTCTNKGCQPFLLNSKTDGRRFNEFGCRWVDADSDDVVNTREWWLCGLGHVTDSGNSFNMRKRVAKYEQKFGYTRFLCPVNSTNIHSTNATQKIGWLWYDKKREKFRQFPMSTWRRERQSIANYSRLFVPLPYVFKRPPPNEMLQTAYRCQSGTDNKVIGEFYYPNVSHYLPTKVQACKMTFLSYDDDGDVLMVVTVDKERVNRMSVSCLFVALRDKNGQPAWPRMVARFWYHKQLFPEYRIESTVVTTANGVGRLNGDITTRLRYISNKADDDAVIPRACFYSHYFWRAKMQIWLEFYDGTEIVASEFWVFCAPASDRRYLPPDTAYQCSASRLLVILLFSTAYVI